MIKIDIAFYIIAVMVAATLWAMVRLMTEVETFWFVTGFGCGAIIAIAACLGGIVVAIKKKV